jgi:hypothetical protein
VTIEVVQKAQASGLDLLTLPLHTSHALQPLNVSVFKPFKLAFRLIRDRNTLRKPGQRVTKEQLGSWVFETLQKALQPRNITSGFRATSIWPLNDKAVENKLRSSDAYTSADVLEELSSDNESSAEGDLGDRVTAPEEAIIDNHQHFYVHIPKEDQSAIDSERIIPLDVECSSGEEGQEQSTMEDIGDFLALPHVPPPTKRCSMQQPLIDYRVSVILTSEDYIKSMHKIASARDKAEAERLQRK